MHWTHCYPFLDDTVREILNSTPFIHSELQVAYLYFPHYIKQLGVWGLHQGASTS